MNQQELNEQIWRDLPFVRRHIVGRERYDDLFIMSVEQFPIDYCSHVSPGSCESQVLLNAWEQSVKRGYCLVYGDEAQFGPLFWILIGPIVQHLLRKLLEWWFESEHNRSAMRSWRAS